MRVLFCTLVLEQIQARWFWERKLATVVLIWGLHQNFIKHTVILRSCRATVRLRWIFSGLDHWIALKIGEVVC